MDAVSLKLARNYTNEKLNSLPSNRPTKTVSFDGGIYSVGNDVVNGQVSDVVIKGNTYTNLVKNGNFSDGTTGWIAPSDPGASLFSVVGGRARFLRVSGGELVGATQYSFRAIDHKYYISFDVEIVVENGTGPYGCFMGTTTATILQDFRSLGVGTHHVSKIATRSAENGALYFNTSSGGCDYYLDNVFVADLTQTFGAGNEPTKDQCDKIFANWFDGTKSTNSVRVKSVGKNLFNLVDEALWEQGSIRADGVYESATYRLRTKGYIAVTPNKTYRISGNGLIVIGVRAYPASKTFVRSIGNVVDSSFTTGPDEYFIRFYISKDESTTMYPADILNIKPQIELGTTATPYEPYKESIVNVNLSEPLRSLPNGVKDEVNAISGVLTRNISATTSISGTGYSSLDTTSFTNVDIIKTMEFPLAKVGTSGVDGVTRYFNKDGVELVEVSGAYRNLLTSVGKYYWASNGAVWVFAAKGAYADIAAARTGLGTTSLIYQLATPIVTKLPAQAPLQVFENGTVYVEPIGDANESTLPSVEMTIPTGNSNKFGVASHDYDGAAADWTLTNSESKCFMLAVSNAGGAANIIAPNRPGTMYAISNASGYAITIKKSGGTGVAVTNAKTVLVIHNGTDYTALTAEL